MDASTVQFPTWPLLRGSRATSDMNLFTYVDMDHSICSKLADLTAYINENRSNLNLESSGTPGSGLGVVCSKSTMETLFQNA